MTGAAQTWPPDVAQAYRRAGYWRGETLDDMLRARSRAHPDRVALVGAQGRWRYRDLDQEAGRIAGGLYALGLRKGDAAVVHLANSNRFFSVCFALFRLGAIPVMALPAHRQAEIGAFCRLTRARAYICGPRTDALDHRELAATIAADAPALEHIVVDGDCDSYPDLDTLDGAMPASAPAAQSHEIALLQLSGGSTGVPKLIPRTHDDYLYSIRRSVEVCGFDAHTRYLAALPLAHNFPLSSPGTLGTLHAGGTVVIAARPAPDEAFELIEHEQVTVTALVPPLARLWLAAAGKTRRNLSSLCLLQVGGGRLDAATAGRVRPTLGCALQQVFGMAEGLVCYTRLDDPDDVVTRTQGRPMSDADEIRVVDDQDTELGDDRIGHLLTRGPYTIRGYYGAPEHDTRAFIADGFYRTGDIVRRTPAGNLIVEGRAKEQINRGGEKIATEEIEARLRLHDQVYDTAVVACPDAFLGERACAFIVAHDPDLRAPALSAYLRTQGVAEYKIPDRFEFVETLPCTAPGKIDKNSLRRRLDPGSQHPPHAATDNATEA